MKITILAVGHLKESYWKAAVAEYTKRLGAYAKIQIIEMDDEKTPDQASAAEEELIRIKEGERIIKKLPKEAKVIALALDGKDYDSEEFAAHLESLAVSGSSHLVFLIGGSLGLSPEVLSLANERISFSRFTFPHQLMRVILLEQLYRSFKIRRNEPYHK